MKIIIGTANFLKIYGLKKKIIREKKIENIFDFAKKNKILNYDCSAEYNNLNKISKYFKKKDKIFFKIKIKKNNYKEISNKIKRIKKKIYCLMIHNIETNSLLKIKKDFSLLNNLAKENSINKIGISIYDLKDLNIIKKNNLLFDYIQIPVNLFNQTFNEKNTKVMRQNGTKFIARSVFFQGLIFDENWKKLRSIKLKNKIFQIDKIVKKLKSTRLEMCIDFIKKLRWIDMFIIGVDSEDHLNNILKAFKKQNKNKLTYKFFINEKKIIDPRLWN